MHPLAEIAQKLTYEYYGNKLEISKYFIHNGQAVQITDGQFLSNGRLSNFWYWRVVNPDGSLGATSHGYGGDEPIFVEISKREAIKYARNH